MSCLRKWGDNEADESESEKENNVAFMKEQSKKHF
jgi:hypothetical protein